MTILESILKTGGVPTLVNALGEQGAVEINAKKYPAIIGALRQEEVELTFGSIEETSMRDVCQAQIQCPAEAIAIKTMVTVPKYGGVFYVRSVDKTNGILATVQLWRESLAKVQRRGTEGPRG